MPVWGFRSHSTTRARCEVSLCPQGHHALPNAKPCHCMPAPAIAHVCRPRYMTVHDARHHQYIDTSTLAYIPEYTRACAWWLQAIINAMAPTGVAALSDGMAVGDELVAVDGTPVVGLSTPQVMSQRPCLLVCLPAYLPACLPACLPVFLSSRCILRMGRQTSVFAPARGTLAKTAACARVRVCACARVRVCSCSCACVPT